MDSEPRGPGALQKPVLLIGYGAFGLRVLRRLLRKGAPRGTLLRRVVQRRGGSRGTHRIPDLALVHVPDVALQDDAGDDHDTADFLVDLYREIETVDPTPGLRERSLGDRARRAVRRLRSQPSAEARQGVPGVDIVMLCGIDGPRAVDALQRDTGVLLQRILADAPDDWRRSAERKVNTLWILDFDNYRHPDARTARAALSHCLRRWKSQLDAGRPALDRCYLFDGEAHDARHNVQDRIDEVTLFLELLLFSGVRNHEDLRWLVEQGRGSSQGQPAAAIGVRCLEHGTELVSRFAAARFGGAWLPYLRGDPQTRFEREPKALAACLAPLLDLVGARGESGGAEAVRRRRFTALERDGEQAADRLEQAILGLGRPERREWIDAAGELFRDHTRGLEVRLSRHSLELARTLRDELLRGDGDNIREAITADLHHDREPVPLASISNRIEATITRLRDQVRSLSHQAPFDPEPRGLVAAHRDYRNALAHWIGRGGRGLIRLWPLLAIVLGLGLTPFAIDLLQVLPTLTADGAPLLDPLRGLARGAARHPWAVTLGLIVVLWAGLAWRAQRRIVRSIARARRLFIDPDRGRLADAVRGDVEGLISLVERARDNLRATLATDLLRILERDLERLHRRHAEIGWLHRQFVEFQGMLGAGSGRIDHGLMGDRFHRLTKLSQDVDSLIPGSENDDRYRIQQPHFATPFTGWEQPYLDTFLDFFPFTDALSEPIRRGLDERKPSDGDPFPSQPGRGELMTFLQELPPRLAFRVVKTDTASPEPETFCIAPPAWSANPALMNQIRQIGVTESRVIPGVDPARLYVLVRQLNLPAEALG